MEGTFRYELEGQVQRVFYEVPNTDPDTDPVEIGSVFQSRGKWRANTTSDGAVGLFKTRKAAAEGLFRQRFGHPEIKER